MSDEIPEEVAQTLLRALAWSGAAISDANRELAWAWVEEQRGNVEEMGG